MISQNLYTKAVEIAASEDPYPRLAGMADFMLPYIARISRNLGDPRFGDSPYFRNIIRDMADEYAFISEYVHVVRASALTPKPWIDEAADNIGQNYMRAYRDIIPQQTEDVPF